MTGDARAPAGDDAPDVAVRQARRDDHDAVTAFTEDTWADRDAGDYVPRVFPEWVDSDGPDQRTFVADAGGEDGVVGLVQVVRLSPWEAWCQGMRVHPDYRGRGVSGALNDACFAWARDRGAAVARLMVFSWNVPGLAAARTNGFEPGMEFRWAHPAPDPDPDAAADSPVVDDPDAAYSFWTDSNAREHLRGLGLDLDESWACSELTRGDLHRAAAEEAVLAVQRGGAASTASGGSPRERAGRDGGTRAMTYRTRTYERESGEGTVETWAEYGAAAWVDLDACRDLLAAVARDAADVGADRTRVLVPETPRHVTDAARAGADLSPEPDFVLGADLS